MTSLDRYLELREAVDFDEVEFGWMAVRLLRAEEIDAAQVGYRAGEDGESLVGDGAGDWRNAWWVIGVEDMLGDPILVDTSEPELPILTAAHGEGAWEPRPIAGSADTFLAALQLVRTLAGGRSSPVELESNPTPEDEVRAVVATAAAGRPIDEEFWTGWLSPEE